MENIALVPPYDSENGLLALITTISARSFNGIAYRLLPPGSGLLGMG